MSHPTDTVTTTVTIPRALRLKLDEVRLARARQEGRLTPPFTQLVAEALEALVTRESHT